MRARRLAAAIALTLLSGCATGESTGLFTVVNLTNVTLVVIAFPNGTLVDPLPHLPPGSYEENMIAPGQRRVFSSVPGYVPGEGVFLFVYVVQQQGADLVMSIAVSDVQLKFYHDQVFIDALPSPRMIPP